MSLLSDSKKRNWGGSDNFAVSLGGGAVTVCAHFFDCCLQYTRIRVKVDTMVWDLDMTYRTKSK